MNIFYGILFSVLVFIALAGYFLGFTSSSRSHHQCTHMLDIISLQSETISILENISLKSKQSNMNSSNCDVSNEKNEASNLHTLVKSNSLGTSMLSEFENECNSRYGVELIEDWKKNGRVVCNSKSSQYRQSKMTCYPYHQAHKKIDGRGVDTFCVAENFVIDFSKVTGEFSSDKPYLGDQYLSFQQGSLKAECVKTEEYRNSHFMPHHSLQMSTFIDNAHVEGVVDYISHPVYLLARDEDCENVFHSTADFMNMYLALSVSEISTADLQVVLFDKHPDGPFLELIKKAFSPNYSLLRHSDYKSKKVQFSKLVFHLESPAGLIFPKVSKPDPLRCYSMGLFQAYRRFVLKAFNLLDVEPPKIPTITLSLRKRTNKKNVGRVLENEREIIEVIKSGNLVDYKVIDGGSVSFSEQLRIIRGTNILIGVHGAGLMMIMFAAEEAILIEAHPSYRQDRHFRHAARMTGKIYMPLRSRVRETCVGTSDNVIIPIDEFKATLDGAVRIARSFDDGLAECGLICPYEILGLDGNLVRDYQIQSKIHNRIDTKFPCG